MRHDPNRSVSLRFQGCTTECGPARAARTGPNPAAGAFHRQIGWSALVAAIWVCGSADSVSQDRPNVENPTAAIQSIRNARDAGNLATAAADLMLLDDRSDVDLSVDFVLLARACSAHAYSATANEIATDEVAVKPDDIDQLFIRATTSLKRSAATSESAGQRLLIRLAAANHFAARQKQDTLVATLCESFDELAQVNMHSNHASTSALVALAMHTAWQALNQQRPDFAESLYGRIVALYESENAETQAVQTQAVQTQAVQTQAVQTRIVADPSTAILGWGWSTALQPGRQQDAAQRLGKFVDLFPEHTDAAKAMAMRIRCLRSLHLETETGSAIADFLHRWPQSPMAVEIAIESLPISSADENAVLASALQRWILIDGDPNQWHPEWIRQAMLWLRSQLPPKRFHDLITCLSRQDGTGQQTTELLQGSESCGDSGFAEQVAATLISGDLQSASPMSVESACRWAGRTRRWTMLSMAAESVELGRGQDQRTVHVERLFAESLTQTGQGEKAYRWWVHVVDQRGADDIATGLRCAEAAVLYGDTAEAQRRVEQVTVAIDEAGDRVSRALVELLAADLAVRRVDFGRARDRYEQVVRSPDAPAKLRGRAQWMIGETYFMQRQYAQAIDSYRAVEGLDPGGVYVAASLVQAGKSFEQLGLTREAGDCYSALLGRFADSDHAQEARRRIAVLPDAAVPAQNRPAHNRPTARR